MDLEEAVRLARKRLIELYPQLGDQEDPQVTLQEVAELHGVGYATTLQWRQRSKPGYEGPGRLTEEFPGELPSHRPNEHRYSLAGVIGWSYRMGKWPNPIARPATRRARGMVSGRHRE